MTRQARHPAPAAQRQPLPARWRSLAMAVVVASACTVQVVDFDRHGITVIDNVAAAKGGGGGGGGNGGGNGAGHGGGNGNSGGGGHDAGHGGHGGVAGGHGADDSGKDGKGHGKDTGVGHSRHGHETAGAGHGHGHASDGGLSASSLGALNAAHASPTALANAAPNSAVGAVAAFARAVESTTLTDEERVEAAAQALASKANKNVTTPVVTEVASLADVSVDDETARAIAERAAEIQGTGN